MAKVIAICNQKGGVGKTTTAISIAACLALQGKKSLLIDLDPQGNCTSGLGVDKHKLEKSVYHVLLHQSSVSDLIQNTSVKNLSLIPSNHHLSGAEVELVNEMGRETKLRKAIAAFENQFEFIFIDCPPSLGLLTLNALTAAKALLIPIQCEYYALEGLSQLMKTVTLVQENLNEALEIEGIVMTMADYRTNLTNEVIDEVKKHFGKKVYRTIIPRNIRLSESPGFGQPIFQYNENSEGARKYKELTDEFLKNAATNSKETNYENKNEGDKQWKEKSSDVGLTP